MVMFLFGLYCGGFFCFFVGLLLDVGEKVDCDCCEPDFGLYMFAVFYTVLWSLIWPICLFCEVLNKKVWKPIE